MEEIDFNFELNKDNIQESKAQEKKLSQNCLNIYAMLIVNNTVIVKFLYVLVMMRL